MKNQQPICGRNNFPLYFNSREQLDLLTDQERGRLLTAVFDYAEYGTEPQTLTPTERLVFAGMRFSLDRDCNTYQEKVATGRANGKRGGRPRKDAAIPTSAMDTSEKTPTETTVNEPTITATNLIANAADPIDPTVGAPLCAHPQVITTATTAAEPLPATPTTPEQPKNQIPTEGSFLNPKKPNPFLETPTTTSTPTSTTTTATASTPTPTSTSSPAAAATTCPSANAKGLSTAAPSATPDASVEGLPSNPAASPNATTIATPKSMPKASPVASATPPAGEEAAAAANPIIFWRDNFGALSPYVLKCITEYRYQGCADDLVVYALERTLEAGSKDFAYARKILDDACQSKLLTRAAFLQHKRHGCSGHNVPVTREQSAANGNFLADAMTRKRKLKHK